MLAWPQLMKIKNLFFLSLIPLLLSPLTLFAQPKLNAANIIKLSDDLMRGDSNQGVYTMNIQTAHWSRELKLRVYSLGRDKIFIRILSPEKEAGIGTLRIKNEMWNFLPRVEKTIKIPPSLMLQPWMGSDFANDDLVKENSIVDDYTHTILAEETVDKNNFYKIELIPKEHAAVIWGKIIRWVHTKKFYPLREEYYNEKEKLIKVLEYSDVATVSDRTIPKTWTMKSMIKPKNATTIRLIDVKYNKPIADNVFTMANLKNVKSK